MCIIVQIVYLGISMCSFLTSYHWTLSVCGTLVYGDYIYVINTVMPETCDFHGITDMLASFILSNFLDFSYRRKSQEGEWFNLSLTYEQIEKNKSSE